jgi:multiple sugar transport system permease protein
MHKALSRTQRDNIEGYLFISPAVIFFSVFVVFPFLFSIYLSFNKWTGGSMLNVKFVGFDQYVRALTDPDFWQALFNTVYYTVVTATCLVTLSLLLAMALNKAFFARLLFRGAFFAPVVMSTTVCGIIWKWIFSPDYGLFNTFVGIFGIKPQGWMTDPDLAMISIIIMSVWKWLGYNMVIYLAALQNIPAMYHESASLDGANGIQKFRYVTLPLLSNTIWFVVIINIIYSFQVFDQIFVTTEGGPIGSTTVLVYYIYQQGFKYFDLGFASAISWILFLVIFFLTTLQMRLSRSEDGSIF